MTAPHRYAVGDPVVITETNLQTMHDSAHSSTTPGYPKDSTRILAEVLRGQIGRVTHVFPPGYEVAVRFGDQMLHMKDNWITPHPAEGNHHD